nr:GIY-YIG nuclease family protein [uncultured Caproiciproducens sp.]
MDKQNKKELAATYKERKITGGVYAVVNSGTGKMLVLSTYDLQGSKNRFEFSQKTNGCINLKLQNDWQKYGTASFHYEVLEELTKKESQTLKEFEDDIHTLHELWVEKLGDKDLY